MFLTKFWKRWITQLDNRVDVLESEIGQLRSRIDCSVCQKCKMVVPTHHAKLIQVISDRGNFTEYYCPKDSPKYDYRKVFGGKVAYFKNNVPVKQ